MKKQIDHVVGRLRERILAPLLLALLISLLVFSAIGLSEYPSQQADQLRRRIEGASQSELPTPQRLALEKDLLQYETDNRIKIWTVIVQAAGGAALLVGIMFSWKNLRAAQDKLDLDRAKQDTDRFTQASAQLGAQLANGNPNIEARLGGIYALATLAHDSPNSYYWHASEIMTAYVRHNAAWPAGGQPAAQSKPRTDIQAILTVLGRSKPPLLKDQRLDQKLDLRNTDLRGAEFWDANLVHADFWGAHLEGAKLWGANLEGAKLAHAHLEGANLRGVRFAGADLTDACLEQADLAGADLSAALGLAPERLKKIIL
ncbi:pentapeptide repeat-containing protein [Roseateles oligotrophus]|uniref:Pentapeptide repeat-containing protein n=1 Tax=Roseateles oligotrophus TaxID=1769250 RepID=A0ABT2YHD4_9BURK|nr:pentapeptide repeat-containing protein [Roseateles oligotrophus]MCV2369467.1 pentapeptide repeat-containing protein [Roseateles oligotrophus]